MAAINKLKGEGIYIKVGNGAAPEVFTHPCLINGKRGIKFGSSQNKEVVPDCDNPDDPAWEECFIDGLNISVDGAGKLDMNAVGFYTDWWQSGSTKNVQIWLGDFGYWLVPMKLPNWNVDGERNKYAEAQIALQSAGPATWTQV